MKNISKILAIILLLTSCRTNVSDNEGLDASSAETDVTTSSGHRFLTVNRTPTEAEDITWQRVQFADVTILVEKMDMGWHEMYLTDNDSIYSTTSDTAYFDLWPGDWFYDKAFKVEQSEFDQIELYEQITYNMAISSNGSIVRGDVLFCVIYDWRTFESPWSKIKLDYGDLRFKSNENNTHAAIDFTLEEFKDAVNEHCGEDWYREIKNIQSKNKLRSELFASQFTFKLVLQNSKTNRVVEKFIVFNPPTSC